MVDFKRGDIWQGRDTGKHFIALKDYPSKNDPSSFKELTQQAAETLKASSPERRESYVEQETKLREGAARRAQAPPPPVTQPPQGGSPFRDFLNRSPDVGAAETLLSVGSSAVAEPIAGYAGILSGLANQDMRKANEAIEGVRSSMTYQPKSEVGQRYLGKTGEFLQNLMTPVDWVGRKMGDVTQAVTGSPTAAGVAQSIPMGLLELAGLKGASSVTRPATRAGMTLPGRTEVTAAAIPEHTAASARRQRVFDEAGLRGPEYGPTRAQVNRNATDWQRQQELAKTDTPVRRRLEAQQGLLSEGFDTRVGKTGGDAANVTSIADEIIGRSTRLDEAISALYEQARAVAPGAKNIRLERLFEELRARAGSNEATKGLLRSIMGDLKQRGVVTKGKLSGRIDVETAERIRQFINQHHGSTTPFGRQVMRDLKDALDEDVLRTVDADIFGQARKAKADYEAGLNRAKVSKFDTQKRNLVRDILNNKLDPDTLALEIITQKKWKAADLRQLRDYLDQTPKGKAAWSDLQARAMQEIKDKSFKGPVDAADVGEITRAKIEPILGRIGDAKLKELFDTDTQGFLSTMREVTRSLEPPKMTALGKGPSAQAIAGLLAPTRRSVLYDMVSKIFFPEAWKAVTQGYRTRQQLAPTGNMPPRLRPAYRPTVPGAAGTATVATQEALPGLLEN